SVTPNAPAETSGSVTPVGYSSTQVWPYESRSANVWTQDKDPAFASNVPAIAVVDSGIQDRADFGSRLVASVNLSTLPGSTGTDDGRGHGTFVAGIAADGLPGITGANPAA